MKPIFLCFALLCALGASDGADVVKAVALLRSTSDWTKVVGTVAFRQDVGSTTTVVQVDLNGLAPNSQHGLHIHELGDVTDSYQGANVGSHYNPENKPHGIPEDTTEHHTGDMGNVVADANGVVSVTKTFNNFLFLQSGQNNLILGRSVVLHNSTDTGGQPTGEAGPKLAVGVVAFQNPGATDNNVATGAAPERLICHLKSLDSAGTVSGTVLFTLTNGKLRVQASVDGLAEGKHGLHVHTYGDLSDPAGGQLGPHWGTGGHGLPCATTDRHTGDYGNLVASNTGKALYDWTSEFTSTSGLIGRGCVVHATEDLGTGTSGDAGAKIAAGTIGIAKADATLDTTGSPALCPASSSATPTPNTTPATDLAVAYIRDGNSATIGEVRFRANGANVEIVTNLPGLASSPRGIHVHTYGDTGASWSSLVGPHFASDGQTHALPPTTTRHYGDLGNTAQVSTLTSDIISLSRADVTSIIGRSIVIHAAEDQGDAEMKTPGAKYARGVIGTLQDPAPTTASGDSPSRLTAAVYDLTDQTLLRGHALLDIVDGALRVQVTLTGLSANGKYGLHLHTFGSESSQGAGLGGHYNPENVNHFLPCSARHKGDLGNLRSDATGRAEYIGLFKAITSLDDLTGRSIVVHSGMDQGTGTSGDAGPKLLAGVLGYANPDHQIGWIAGAPQATYDCTKSTTATATFQSVTGVANTVSGTVTLAQELEGVRVTGLITGLTAGSTYGFHIHALGDVYADGSRVGGHFNPFESAHGLPTSSVRHAGDLGNIVADAQGQAIVNILQPHALVSLTDSIRSVVGRAFVIHSGPDSGAQPTGGAGPKLAIAPIGIANSDDVPNVSQGVPGVSEAVCHITTGSGVTGTVTFARELRGVRVKADIQGLSSGKHGLHVHTFGDLSDGVNKVGGHYNPDGSEHGLGCASVRHVGDMGNLEQVGSSHKMNGLFTRFTSLENHLGRACVVHSGEDTGVQPTGGAGEKVAAGVIGMGSGGATTVDASGVTAVSCEAARLEEAKSSGKKGGGGAVAGLAVVLVLVVLAFIGTVVFLMKKLNKASSPQAQARQKGMEQL